MLATRKGHLNIVQQLLEAGADKEAKDDGGRTALDYAREKGHTSTIANLLEQYKEPYKKYKAQDKKYKAQGKTKRRKIIRNKPNPISNPTKRRRKKSKPNSNSNPTKKRKKYKK